MKLLAPSRPRFGVNYDVGWIGFLHHNSFVANGIGWFTRWWRKGAPSVSHVFVVIGENRIIEANWNGVEVESLLEYTLYNDFVVYLRKPVGWTPALGSAIAAEAKKFEGFKYDKDLIIADAFSYSLFGRLFNSLTNDTIDSVLTDLADSRDAMICDKLAVVAMQAQPSLHPLGTMKQPASRNNPQRLFGDDEVFDPEVTVINGGPANA